MKYLSGVLVGNQMVAEASTNHLVGVVGAFEVACIARPVIGRRISLPPCLTTPGAFPIAETYRHINAFIRGCVEADPLCRVAVVWTMTWHDEYIERWAGTRREQ
jgi:hypothetical protein